ncbi:MAG TPA: YifB family Mg chelatase-like AAA ATPase [bacterium]|nr:YifB family Mg chelatase-like AAA ATPase [bacterium]HPP29888.1 YifB family Mg chelatase-like AAA ATPase [bacterium]
MLAKINSLTIWGIEGVSVDVEVDISFGMPTISIVGLPDQAVKESRDRIKPAIKNSGFEFPSDRRVVINLAPADLKKEGAYFDLPVAIGILAAEGLIPLSRVSDFSFVGELALDGSLRGVKGILPIAIKLAELKSKKIIVPADNATEAAIVRDIEVYPVNNLKECVAFLTGKKEIERAVCDVEELFNSKKKYSVDFKDVKGQAYAKRAIEVAVSGGHNILMIGSPGAGKTMLASRIPSILPQLTLPEALEITKVHSVAGILKEGIVTERPFRAPHHTISDIALIGGGNIPKPGEVSLAHNGVLFLDELPEFHRDVLEVLRQPLEDGKVSISRAKGRMEFPARFLMAASMNPCPCGWYGDSARQCNCTLSQILKYRRKISGPLLDRIDIHIEVSSLPAGVLLKDREEEPSEKIRKRVEKARKIQEKRFEGEGIYFNAHMNTAQIKKYCVLNDECQQLVRTALEKMHLSARAYDRIRKVARTIADLEGSDTIQTHHLAEAIQYRCMDREG